MHLHILLNGASRGIAPGISVAQLLAEEALAGRRVAVEVNGQIIARSAHAIHVLYDGDRVEIVHALGGG